MASTTVQPPTAPPPSEPPPPTGGSKPGGIARATGLMMATVLLSRILGVLRDAIISHYFGRGPQTDAYNAAFTVPDLLFYLLQSGALSSTIVPIITEYRQQGKNKSADRVVSIVASTIFVVIGLLICVMWIAARPLTVWLNPGFDAHRVAMAVPLTRVLLPAQMFFFLGGLLMGVLYSRKQFLIPALGPVIYNSGIIFGGIVLRHWLGIHGLVWGAVGGALLGNFLIPFLAVRRLGVRLRPNFAVLHPGARKVWVMLLPMGLGVALPNIDQIVNKLFASYLGPGDTTAIMNAYRLMLLPIGVFAQAMALAIYPTLSEQAGLRDLKAMRRTMSQSLRNILFLTVPSAALMFLLAVPIITFLLQSGKYTYSDTLVTASALRYLSLGIFAWSCQSLLTRGFYALQNSRIPVISGACVSVLFVAMNWAVVHHTHWGVRGLGLATSIAAAIHMTALLILLRLRLRGIQGGRLWLSLSQTLLATAALCLAVQIVRALTLTLLPAALLPPKFSALILIALSGGAGLAAFLLVARLLHMEELQAAISMIRRKRSRE
ncbi:MAG: murein biosynthesis integral membrane protein MurJ [Armatimonadetes bacterium]|nr:murein biosynthesis integral membrane protein MurJ [Armatimonadota bacterium]